ncbi:MAG: DUF624 domain-containing protein [Clostridia bacterium]|nr:DUF624 domain-containing protein [Clostridia bacterium]
MLNQVFNPENGLFRVTGKLFDMVVLSVLWAMVCIPVFTVGPATAALYHTVVKCVRGNECDPYRRFFRSFHENFKVGTAATLICLALWAFLGFGYMVMAAAAETGSMGFVMFVAYYTALLVPAGFTCWLFAVLGRFTFGVGGLLTTSFKLALAHLPSTVVVAFIGVQAVLLTIQYWIPVALAPALAALLWSLFLERIFAPYLPKEPEDPAGKM